MFLTLFKTKCVLCFNFELPHLLVRVFASKGFRFETHTMHNTKFRFLFYLPQVFVVVMKRQSNILYSKH